MGVWIHTPPLMEARLVSDLLLSDPSTLKTSNSVAVVIKTERDEYLLQHRWNRPGFYFPGFWGLFGGGMEPNERPEQAARRELLEEFGLNVAGLELIMRFDFDFAPLGLNKIGR